MRSEEKKATSKEEAAQQARVAKAGVRSHPASIAIHARFFKALRYLVKNGQVKSIYEFTHGHGINPGNFHALEKEPERLTLPVIYLYYLISEHRVSAHWLFTGKGEMINPE